MRLTVGDRERICELIIKDTFKDETSKLEGVDKTIGMQMYCMLYSSSIHKKIEDLPKGWLPEAGLIEFAMKDYGWQQLKLLDENGTQVKKRFLHKDVRRVALSPDENPKMYKKLSKHLDAKVNLSDLISKARTETMAVLKSSSTPSSLAKSWPEIEQYVNKVCAVGKSNLPAPMIDDLNKMLKLPRKN